MVSDIQIQEELGVKQRLAYTLMELMNTVSYSKISVSMIIEKSGISRATFYRHFADKDALLQCSYLNIAALDAINVDVIQEWPKKLVVFCQQFKDYLTYYKKAFSYTGPNSLFEVMIQHGDEATAERVMKVKCVDTLDEELTYAVKHYSRGNVYMIHDWVMAGAPGTAEHMANLMLSCVPFVLAKYML